LPVSYSKELQKALSPEQFKMFELLGPPAIVSGEDVGRYYRFFAAVVQTMQPQDIQDCIYVREQIDLEWSILRYRNAKARIIGQAKNLARSYVQHCDVPQNSEDEIIARAIQEKLPHLRRLDLMIESEEVRRDRAYREIERRRAVLAKKLRDTIKQQAKVHAHKEAANPDRLAA
jgi:hypothetical protein